MKAASARTREARMVDLNIVTDVGMFLTASEIAKEWLMWLKRLARWLL